MPQRRDLQPATTDPANWLDQHGDYLFAGAMALVGRIDVAEDLVQETLLAAILHPDRFEGRSSVRTWLASIMRHKAIDRLRRLGGRGQDHGTEEALESHVDGQFSSEGKWRVAPGEWGADPQSILQRAEFRAVLAECVSRLPPRVADAFLLAEERQLGARNIADVLGVTATNVGVMLYRARTALRGCLEERWFGRKDRRDE